MCVSPIKGLAADVLISVAELAYGRKRIYGRNPSNSGSGYEEDKGEVYQALARRRMEENESFN
ncbi:hypothetical protein M405DRAFT_817688 [Rhizopogon salebrosus TDB-379]|nr:hypothetical protein M405DRAFT_817688 [Rhizopogon salebrosus TDB-379]